ncbi:MAG: beta-3-deoxy-D-manno-oct-2-ulosonic acid transferase [Pseudomonadota bacterium]
MSGRPAAKAALLPPPIPDWPIVAFHGENSWPEPDVSAARAQIIAEDLWRPAPRTGADEAGGQWDDDGALSTSRWIDPWRGHELSILDGVSALSFLHHAARRNRGEHKLIGMSPWKRRCVAPFLTGPDGPPGDGGRPVVWGGDVEAQGALRVEDGFLRSVGLGLRHTPPASLTFDETAPYFDATKRNGFEETVSAATFDVALTERARALRNRVLSLRLTKYNLVSEAALPDAGEREAVLVPGQVETDASIRLGGAEVRTNAALMEAARELHPDAFIIYKPHPDVLTGMREGDVPGAHKIADHVEADASAPDCLDWADRVVTITSLMGFEALMRGKAVTTLGRPFYSGWGLTDDRSPPKRDRTLTLDELVAAALILYPRYVDPVTRLPAPVEVVVEALAEEIAAAGTLSSRAKRVWRGAASWVLNRI